MFNRRCHKLGEAVKVYGGLITLCKCLTGEELIKVYKMGKDAQLEESKNV